MLIRMREKMKKIIVLFGGIILLVAIAIIYYPKPAIMRVDSGKALEQQWPAVDKDTLVIFDIDNVLLVHADPWERGYKKERSEANTVATLYKPGSPLERTLDRQTRDHLWSLYALARKEMPVDTNILALVKKLQKESVKVIALTRFLVGRLGTIPAGENLRIDALKEYGIDFSPAFSAYPLIVFDHCNYEGKFPLFKNGILFTTLACSKGELLKAFFEKVGWKPRFVIMVDDKRDNMESVHKVLKEMGIAFKGFEYTGAEKLPSLFDKEIAEFQMQHLIDHKEWLTGDQAQQRLKEQNVHEK